MTRGRMDGDEPGISGQVGVNPFGLRGAVHLPSYCDGHVMGKPPFETVM